ncbi:MAG: response regulator [Lachnospiraceae bacterium]|nr:response regulator [Lachnospiraceae bacterium]MDE6982735.1 response regulator [Lachnospiraceae bacterium]
MYKVVIIDDEPIIVEGLSKAVHWEKWNCQVVATAENGQSGIEIIKRENPDILFSDIRMPGMDGLSMIAALKSEHPHMQIAILTGFRDFEYAREAIRLGVTRFLLKPSKMEELEEAVKVMVQNLSHRKESTEEEKIVEEPEEAAAGSFIAQNAVKYIEENYMEKLKLSDVADHVYVSQWHLSKILNQHVEKSFSDILNHARIEKAKELLREPSLRIGDIAEKVGFLDMAHFSRVFKKHTGFSANEFRNQMKSEKE